MTALRERPRPYHPAVTAVTATPPARAPDGPFPEHLLTALWLLGRVPAEALPSPLLRRGRAGRGPGPDVREATLLLPSGVPRTGDVEVHLRAGDFARHGHAADPAYAGVVLHLCWEDDRPAAARGAPTPLPGGGVAPTVALAPLLRDPARVRALVARGPAGPAAAGADEPCAGLAERLGAIAAAERVRAEGRRRLAERTWRAWRLVDALGVDAAFMTLLERALAATAGRVREPEAVRALHAARLRAALGREPAAALALRAAAAGSPAPLIDAFRLPVNAAGGHADGPLASGGSGVAPLARAGIGAARAAEVAWNVALPLLAALAAAYDDVALARATAALATSWPAPRPYGRTLNLGRLTGPPPAAGEARAAGLPAGGGALYAQGLLHLQDLWCSRGGCGVCPLSSKDR